MVRINTDPHDPLNWFLLWGCNVMTLTTHTTRHSRAGAKAVVLTSMWEVAKAVLLLC